MKAALALTFALGSWSWLGEEWAPARLEDCPKGTSIVINYNVGIAAPWRRFCYTGRDAK